MDEIARQFNLTFEHWKIDLPPEDIARRGRGKIVQTGWATLINKELNLIPHFAMGKSKVVFKRSEVDSWMESRRRSKGFMGPPLDEEGEINFDAIIYRATYEVHGAQAAAEWWARAKRRKESRARRLAEKAQNSVNAKKSDWPRHL